MSCEFAAAGEPAAHGSFSTDTAYLSKMQMLRELGFLSETTAEADALARSQNPLPDSQRNVESAEEIGQDQSRSYGDAHAAVAEAVDTAEYSNISKAAAVSATSSTARAAQRSPEERYWIVTLAHVCCKDEMRMYLYTYTYTYTHTDTDIYTHANTCTQTYSIVLHQASEGEPAKSSMYTNPILCS